MRHYCPRCDRIVPANEVSGRGKHDPDNGGCGFSVRRIDVPVEIHETWWDRNWWSVMASAVGIGLAIVILYNAGVFGER